MKVVIILLFTLTLFIGVYMHSNKMYHTKKVRKAQKTEQKTKSVKHTVSADAIDLKPLEEPKETTSIQSTEPDKNTQTERTIVLNSLALATGMDANAVTEKNAVNYIYEVMNPPILTSQTGSSSQNIFTQTKKKSKRKRKLTKKRPLVRIIQSIKSSSTSRIDKAKTTYVREAAQSAQTGNTSSSTMKESPKKERVKLTRFTEFQPKRRRNKKEEQTRADTSYRSQSTTSQVTSTSQSSTQKSSKKRSHKIRIKVKQSKISTDQSSEETYPSNPSRPPITDVNSQ